MARAYSRSPDSKVFLTVTMDKDTLDELKQVQQTLREMGQAEDAKSLSCVVLFLIQSLHGLERGGMNDPEG